MTSLPPHPPQSIWSPLVKTAPPATEAPQSLQIRQAVWNVLPSPYYCYCYSYCYWRSDRQCGTYPMIKKSKKKCHKSGAFSTCSSPLTPRRRRPSPVVVLVIVLVIFCYCGIYFICMHMFSLVHATQEKTITCDQQRAGWAGRAGRYLLMLFCYCYRFCYCYCYFVIVAVFLLLILQIKITKRRGMICGPKISRIKIKMCFFHEIVSMYPLKVQVGGVQTLLVKVGHLRVDGPLSGIRDVLLIETVAPRGLKKRQV